MTESEKQYALIDIAITKAFNYSQEYDPSSGYVKDKTGYLYLKQGFTDGFLAGVAFRLNGGTNGSD